MIINFNGGLSEEDIRQIVDEELHFLSGVINLSTATAAEIIDAFDNPDKWLCSFDYNDTTYLEVYRRGIFPSGIYEIYFYVIPIPIGQPNLRIRDGKIVVTVNPTTGEVNVGNLDYAPDIVYDIDRMTVEQLQFLEGRARNNSSYPDRGRFTAKWTYNDRKYVYCAGGPLASEFMIIGSCITNDGLFDTNRLYYDKLYIDPTGAISHTEYRASTTFTKQN